MSNQTPNLTELGFSDKEAAVYLCVLRHGRISPANVARITKINRSTVYFVSKELLAKGLIAEDTSTPTAFLLALPPEGLVTHLEQRERELQRTKEKARQAVAELQAIAQETRYVAPKVTFVTQEQIDAHLHKRTPEWNRSMAKTDSSWWGFQDPSLLEKYGDWITWYWQQPSSESVSVRLLTNDAQAERDLNAQGYARRQAKLWERSRFTGTQWVAGEYIINIITSQEPHYLVEIKDAVMAENLREMFKGMWEMER